ncbi:nucleotidyltransferase family protein [Lentisphaera marina]|uniref:nucleotidyltransferase family protein n=1 Tax=Lentisphaera marina TaxID=1111041 RepID=UPI002365E946|nr:nucleotidyltransferase family protein [Lentisphaera marina]MDD7985737.1 nucleotidyltransferase family protein [Lentisphaera marina]
MSDPVKPSVLILAGGLGTRLRSVVSDRPKVMADVDGKPFLEHLLTYLYGFGFRHFVISTGYMADLIKDLGVSLKGISIEYCHEGKPMGTGGAIRLALPYFKSETVLVMNGDSFCSLDYNKFLESYHLRGRVDSLVITEVEDVSRYGFVELSTCDRVKSFEEKGQGSGVGFINAGIYLLNKTTIESLPQEVNISLEKEVFPNMSNLHAFKTSGPFIDIGTPESYDRAGQFFNNLRD